MTNDKIEDPESSVPTLRPKVTAFSQRPTIPIPVIKTQDSHIDKQYPPIRYKFYLIGIIIVAIIICAIMLIAKPLQSYSMPGRTVFNLSPIVIPTDSAGLKSIEVTPIVPDPTNSVKPSELKPAPQIKAPVPISPKVKDYGIDDLINPYNQPIIYKL